MSRELDIAMLIARRKLGEPWHRCLECELEGPPAIVLRASRYTGAPVCRWCDARRGVA